MDTKTKARLKAFLARVGCSADFTQESAEYFADIDARITAEVERERKFLPGSPKCALTRNVQTTGPAYADYGADYSIPLV